MYHRNRHHHRKKQNIFFPFFGVVFLFTFLALLWVSLHPEQIEKNTLPENVITSLQSSVQKNFTALYTFKEDPCRPKPTTEQKLLDLPLTLVTAASHSYFGHLQNLVGSVHYWEPTMEIAVIDLGLESKREIVEKWCHVTVLDFPFEKYPKHVRNLKNFAWKALVVQQGIEEFGKILYLDSGYELRRPIDYIKERIEREGYFCTGMGDSLTRGSRRRMFEFFNTTMETFFGKPMSAGGVHGATYWGGGYEAVIKPAVECSIVASCIEPSPSGVLKEVRSYGKDQPLFSMLVHMNTCVQCAMDSAFTLHYSLPHMDNTKIGSQVLFHRRGGGPYRDNIQTKEKCPSWTTSRNRAMWRQLKPQLTTSYLGTHPCQCSMSTYSKLYPPSNCSKIPNFSRNHRRAHYSEDLIQRLRSEFVIVTAASSQNYDQLKRFLDSVTRYEPKMHTVVFDLGLSNQELSELSQHKQVTVRSFKFLVDPSWRHLSHYLKQLENNAWRPLVIQESILKYENIIFISPDHTFENPLDTLLFQLWRDGVFSIAVGGNVMKDLDLENLIAKESWFWKMKLAPEHFIWKPLCSLSVFGFRMGSTVYSGVIEKIAQCALDENCWLSKDFTLVRSTEDYASHATVDNILLSILLYNNTCYTCNRDYDFYAYAGSKIHSNTLFSFRAALMSEFQVLFKNPK